MGGAVPASGPGLTFKEQMEDLDHAPCRLGPELGQICETGTLCYEGPLVLLTSRKMLLPGHQGDQRASEPWPRLAAELGESVSHSTETISVGGAGPPFTANGGHSASVLLMDLAT